jgi:hypothetical protein
MIAEPIARPIAQPLARGLVASSGGAWTPSSIPGLLAWYDASDAASFTYSSGTSVQTWADKSGGGRTLTYFAGVGSRPTRGATDWSGTQPGVTFVDGFLAAAAGTGKKCAVLAVCKPATLDFAYRGVANDDGWMLWASDLGAVGRWGTNAAQANTRLTSGTKYLLEMSGGAAGTFYLNGTSDGTYPSTGGGTDPKLRLGAIENTQVFSGVIAEVLLYDPTLITDPGRAQIRTYLMSKWGIP